MTAVFSGRLAVQQRLLPAYRAPFFDALAQSCSGGVSVFAGLPGPGEAIQGAEDLQVATWQRARNFHFRRISSSIYLCWQFGLLDWLDAEQPDVLVMEANPRYLSSRRAITWMHARRRPVIGWGLGAPSGAGLLEGVRLADRRRFLLSFDALIAYSQRGADQYRSLGFPGERIFVAPNAVTPRPSAPPPARPEFFADQPHVLFVGRMQARKRLDLLLQACSMLPGELQPQLTLVGDGPALAEFRACAERVYPAADFPGARRGAALEPYFAAADLFVLPGTGGLAVQQAMAYGLPVIVAKGDGTQDDLVRPANGWQVPPDDLQRLQITLADALSDPGRLRRMGAESYCIVSQEINLEQMVGVFTRAAGFVSQLYSHPL